MGHQSETVPNEFAQTPADNKPGNLPKLTRRQSLKLLFGAAAVAFPSGLFLPQNARAEENPDSQEGPILASNLTPELGRAALRELIVPLGDIMQPDVGRVQIGSDRVILAAEPGNPAGVKVAKVVRGLECSVATTSGNGELRVFFPPGVDFNLSLANGMVRKVYRTGQVEEQEIPFELNGARLGFKANGDVSGDVTLEINGEPVRSDSYSQSVDTPNFFFLRARNDANPEDVRLEQIKVFRDSESQQGARPPEGVFSEEFLRLNPEMAGAAFNLRFLKKPAPPDKNPEFFRDPNNYLPGLTLPRVKATYWPTASLDVARMRPNDEIEIARFYKLNGEWKRSGEYLRAYPNPGDNRITFTLNVDDPEQASKLEERVIRIKISGKAALVERYYYE